MKYLVTARPNGQSAKSDPAQRRHLLITAEIFEQSCWYEVCLQSLCRPKQSSPLTTMPAFISLSSIVWDQMSRQLAQRNLTHTSHVIYSFNQNHNKHCDFYQNHLFVCTLWGWSRLIQCRMKNWQMPKLISLSDSELCLVREGCNCKQLRVGGGAYQEYNDGVTVQQLTSVMSHCVTILKLQLEQETLNYDPNK